MKDESRRRFIQSGIALGAAGALPYSASVTAETPSDLEKYIQPLPIPETKEPDEERNGTHYYEMPLTEFSKSFHPDLPETTVWGVEDQYPGPTISTSRDQPIEVLFDDISLPSEHLFEIDTRIDGTTPENHPMYDDPVPDVRTSIHLHGLSVRPEDDGQSMMWTSPDGAEGPHFETDVHRIQNHQPRMSSAYHDHTLGIARLNVYAGLFGMYTISSQEEQELDLPEGPYDIPLILQDKSFDEDGSLEYPDAFASEWAGDTAVVNGAIWPNLEVEPRQYRFRILNASNHRTYNLSLSGQDSSDVPTLHQFAPDHGFLESIVSVGPESDHDLDSILLTPFERAEIIVDFSDHAGESYVLSNDAEFPYMGDNSGADLDEFLRIEVTDSTEETDADGSDLTDLDLPSPPEFDPEEARTTRHHTLDVTFDEEVNLTKHLLNGYGIGDEEAVFEPHLNTTEVWELENQTSHAHPMHLHLVKFRVIGRGPDGTEDPDPNELGLKDVVRVNPDETVRIIPEFEDYTGRYPWHCHALEHEDFKMMTPFEVVRSEWTYANEEDVVDTNGILEAIHDWRDSNLDPDVLADVIEAWRTAEPLTDE